MAALYKNETINLSHFYNCTPSFDVFLFLLYFLTMHFHKNHIFYPAFPLSIPQIEHTDYKKKSFIHIAAHQSDSDSQLYKTAAFQK